MTDLLIIFIILLIIVIIISTLGGTVVHIDRAQEVEKYEQILTPTQHFKEDEEPPVNVVTEDKQTFSFQAYNKKDDLYDLV